MARYQKEPWLEPDSPRKDAIDPEDDGFMDGHARSGRGPADPVEPGPAWMTRRVSPRFASRLRRRLSRLT